MPSMIDVGRKATSTYANIVDAWEEERKTLGTVQPYTAKKAAEKARALLPWLGKMSLDDISPSDIKRALIELGTNGGRSGDGLSPSTLRAAHLAGSMTFEWAIANDLATINPFKQVPRPKASRTQTKVLDSDQAAHLTAAMTSTMRRNVLPTITSWQNGLKTNPGRFFTSAF